MSLVPLPRPPALVILDRDGVITQDAVITDPADVRLLSGVGTAMARLNKAGVPVVVATNQSAIGRGWMTEARLAAVQAALTAALAAEGASLTEILHAPDHPDVAGPRRKPAPGMLQEALTTQQVQPGEAVMIGDALRDLQAAATAGCAAILVETGKGKATAQDLAKNASALPGAPHLGHAANFAHAVELLLTSQAVA